MPDELTLPPKLIDIHNHVAADDADAARLLGIMDAANVATTLVMGTSGASNERMLRAVAKHPDRLVGGAYIDPRQGAAAIEQVRHYRAEGICLVKLFPNYGYYPDDDAYRGVFDVIAELGMGVLSHCGWLAPHMGVTAAYYSHPGRFEKVIRSYPETPFIMAHMGGIAGFLESVMLTTRTPNTYVDCSPGQGVWVLECTGHIAASIPPAKLMWGADCYDYTDMLARQRKALAERGFAPHAEAIFYSNARGVLEKIGALPAGR